MSTLNKVVKISLSDQVCTMLRDNISCGDFPVGSRLPSETELAELFGVSRLTVRMALQKLSAQGLTITKPGDGTFVKKFDIAEYLDEVSDVTMKPDMLDSVLEFRQCLESTSIALAIERASDEDFLELEALLEKMKPFYYDCTEPENIWRERLDQYLELDFQFHATICKLSGNALFHLAYTTAKAPICAYMRQLTENHIHHYRKEHPNQDRVSIERVTDNNDHGAILRDMKQRNLAAIPEIFRGPIDYKR